MNIDPPVQVSIKGDARILGVCAVVGRFVESVGCHWIYYRSCSVISIMDCGRIVQ